MDRQPNRESLLQYAKEQYGTDPEYLWKKSPHHAVLRRQDNQKWYAVVMQVPKNNLGLNIDEINDILTIKVKPFLLGSLQQKPGFLAAYHMNKENWTTILLDGSVSYNEIIRLIDMNYDLVKKHK